MTQPTEARTCFLCGLPLSGKTFFLDPSSGKNPFCCKGCLQVFVMLSESADENDGRRFQETELFKKCQALGIIPRGPEDIAPVKSEGIEKEKPSLESKDLETLKSSGPGRREGLVMDAKISGMWCPACAWIVEEAALKDPGVQEAACHFSTDRFRCVYDPVKTSPKQILQHIESLGYQAGLGDDADQGKTGQGEWAKMIVSAFLTMNTMMFSFALYVGFFDTFSPDTVFKLSLPVFLMAASVLFYGGKDVFLKTLSGIRSAAFGMETLIATGALVAFLYSTYNLTRGSLHLYYDTAAMLITLALIGKRLENSAKNRIQADLDYFFSLVPNKVRLITDEYPSGRYVSARALRTGGRFRVETGEIVAADGVILEGAGHLDESALTGEARPVRKERSDRLQGGSKILQGAFTVRAEAVGKDSIFGKMLTLMEEALAQKGPHEKRAEKILRWFVPGILLSSVGVVFLLLVFRYPTEEAIVRGITMMVVTCPCVLGIAIPLARTAGTSLLLKNGILLRDFSALDHVKRIAAYVFDKTGTLTLGRWRLEKVLTEKGIDDGFVLSLAAALEKDSIHYVAAEILEHARQKGIEAAPLDKVRHFQDGISGVFQSREVKIGSEGFVMGKVRNGSPGFVKPAFLDEIPERDALSSKVFLSLGGKIRAAFIFSDPIRPGAAEIISRLKKAGSRVVLVSGDNPFTTQAAGKKLGIPEALGGLFPAEKARRVKHIQEETGPVAMIGDGINDAPAMVQADLAVAVYSGSPLGKEASHVTLMRGDPRQLADFIIMGNRIRKKMYQNLAWAFVYNIFAIPIAAAGLLTPIAAVCVMLLSSLSVIGNTLLLLRGTPKNPNLFYGLIGFDRDSCKWKKP